MTSRIFNTATHRLAGLVRIPFAGVAFWRVQPTTEINSTWLSKKT